MNILHHLWRRVVVRRSTILHRVSGYKGHISGKAVCGTCAAPGMMTKYRGIYIHDATLEQQCRPEDVKAYR